MGTSVNAAVRKHVAVGELAVAALLGLLVAASTLWLADLGMRYVVVVIVATLAATILVVVRDHQRLFLAVFFLSLQLEATMFFLYRGGSRSVGWSGPPGIELPLAFIPALVLFLMAIATAAVAKTRAWDWGNGVGRAGFLLVLASLLSCIPSNEKFLTLCSVLRAVDLVIIFLAVANTVHEKAQVRLVLWLLPTVLVTQSLVYFAESALGMTFELNGDLVEQAGTIGRHGGTVGVAAAGFASFIHPLVQYALASFLASDERHLRRRTCVLAMGMLAMLLTYTRAAWAGMAIGATVVIVLGLRWKMVNRRRVAAVAFFALLGLAITYPKMAMRMASNAADAEERLGLRMMAMAVIKAHPLLGVGAGTYGFEFLKYIPSDLRNDWLYVVHNAYLLRWAETGILGIVGMLALLIYAARDAYTIAQSTDNDVAIFGLGWLGGLTAMAWEMYWDIWHGFPYNALLWALCGFAIAVRRIDSRPRVPRVA